MGRVRASATHHLRAIASGMLALLLALALAHPVVALALMLFGIATTAGIVGAHVAVTLLR